LSGLLTKLILYGINAGLYGWTTTHLGGQFFLHLVAIIKKSQEMLKKVNI